MKSDGAALRVLIVLSTLTVSLHRPTGIGFASLLLSDRRASIHCHTSVSTF
jgi:hypothetical protein